MSLDIVREKLDPVGEPEIQKLVKKWPESSRILDYIIS